MGKPTNFVGAIPAPMGAPIAQVSGALSGIQSANAVIADTLAIAAAGNYRITAHLSYAGTIAAGKEVILVLRNAADSGDTRILGACPAEAAFRVEIERQAIAANERVVARLGGVASVASESLRASISVFALPSD